MSNTELRLPTSVENIIGGEPIATAQLGLIEELASSRFAVVRLCPPDTRKLWNWVDIYDNLSKKADGISVGSSLFRLSGYIHYAEGTQVFSLDFQRNFSTIRNVVNLSRLNLPHPVDCIALDDGRVYMPLEQQRDSEKLAVDLGLMTIAGWEYR